jgi:nitrite reductase/ring-hydroxylating ferredoxin subunit
MIQQEIPVLDGPAGEFIKVAKVDDIHAGESSLVEVDGMRITIFNSHGAFYATDSDCVYCHGPLSKAQLTGTEIQCPSDGASFYLPTGESVWPKADHQRLVIYRVRVDGRNVEVKVGGL